jgi:predicted Fe-Mo cluster-binding NifX family protein
MAYNDSQQRKSFSATADALTLPGLTTLAISSTGPAMSDRVDPRFGRAAGYIVIDLKTGHSTFIDNGASQSLAHGAGIQAAETLADAGVQAVITGSVGPKAYAALSAAGIKIGQGLNAETVGEALELFNSGAIPFADKPNAQAGANK